MHLLKGGAGQNNILHKDTLMLWYIAVGFCFLFVFSSGGTLYLVLFVCVSACLRVCVSVTHVSFFSRMAPPELLLNFSCLFTQSVEKQSMEREGKRERAKVCVDNGQLHF